MPFNVTKVGAKTVVRFNKPNPLNNKPDIKNQRKDMKAKGKRFSREYKKLTGKKL